MPAVRFACLKLTEHTACEAMHAISDILPS